jgi:hypothetical protein
MPSERAITQMMEILTEVIDLGGVEERTAIVPNLTVIDNAPTGLTNFIVVQDDRDGDNILAKTVPGVVYANSDLVNVLFIRGAEPIAFQQGSESPNAGLWEIVPSTSTDIFYDKGNVGIGVATPQALLDVAGDVLLSGGTQDYLLTDRSNFLEIQSQTAATAFALELFSNDGDGTDDINLNLFAVGTPAAVTNRERLQIKYEATGTRFEILTEANGTGTLRPLILYTEGNANQLYLDTDGDVGIGNSAPQVELEISAASNPNLRISEASSTTSYFRLEDTSAQQAKIEKVAATGSINLDINPIPSDNLGNALFRFFRATNTAGNKSIALFRGDGSATQHGQIGVDGLDTYFAIPTGGDFGIGTSSPAARLDVDQVSTTAAIPVQRLDQADVDEPFTKYVGSAAAATLTRSIVAEADVTTATRQGFVKIEIEDVGNQVTDQDYFVPFYTLA